jgi:NifU-like protein involved in Fe-S cluster formation
MDRFSAKLLDHFYHPRNPGAREDADIIGRGSLDGRPPRTEIYLKLADGVVGGTGFTTFGCGTAIACASVLTELISGKSLEDCRTITAGTLIDALDGVPDDKRFCADIAASALADALRQWTELKVPGE